VVVNDSLVLVTFLNRMHDAGISLEEAAERAGQVRFRAIMLTSLTTFAGLTPIMLDATTQAQFVIPMAISLSFGVVVASVFTLLLVPAVVLIAEDLRQAFRRIARRVGGAASQVATRI
jgi:multidrug efflux pump subunit AcrB